MNYPTYDKVVVDAKHALELAAQVDQLDQKLAAAIKAAELRGKVDALRDIGQRLERVSDHITPDDVRAFGLTQKARANEIEAGRPDPAEEYARLYTEGRSIAGAGRSG